MATTKSTVTTAEAATTNPTATQPTVSIPDSFLTTPLDTPPTRHLIDWPTTTLPEYEGYYAVHLDNVLSAAECATLLSLTEQHAPSSWERALVNVGQGRQEMYTEVRNCDRIIWDDEEVVARIWKRCEESVPEIGRLQNWANVMGVGPVRRREVWKLRGLNERMRVLRYGKGEYFKPHGDGAYVTPDNTARSMFTLHLYLNDADHQPEGSTEELVGGATTFWSMNEKRRVDVAPKIGSVLIFQHRGLLHSGDDVLSGTKITMRTDIMYELADELAEAYENENKKRDNRFGWLSWKK